MENAMADSWKGGTSPEASVNRASKAHMTTAAKPASVARPIDPSVLARASFGAVPYRASENFVAVMSNWPRYVGMEALSGP